MAGIHVSVVEPQHRGERGRRRLAQLERRARRVRLLRPRTRSSSATSSTAIPPELKPNLGPLANPINFFTENHFTAIGLAPASVTSLATPPFPVVDIPPFDAARLRPRHRSSRAPARSATPGSPPRRPTSPPPEAAAAPAPARTPRRILDGALPAALVALALLLSPLFGLGSTKLADNVLAPVSNSCPTGHDKPPPARLT